MLKISKLNAGYGSFQALFDIDIEVNAGEAVAVIGPNGAGKTTLMRAVSGLIPVKSGSVDMEGVDLINTPSHDIVKLGIAHVPEHRRLFPRMSVEDNMRMGAFSPQFREKYNERLDFVFLNSLSLSSMSRAISSNPLVSKPVLNSLKGISSISSNILKFHQCLGTSRTSRISSPCISGSRRRKVLPYPICVCQTGLSVAKVAKIT